MDSAIAVDLRSRVEDRIRDWGLIVEGTLETEGSIIAFGKQRSQPIVLKVVKNQGDEWHSGEALGAFEGRAVVRVFEHVEGAVLMERLSPGNSLAELVLEGRDDEATEILAAVIEKMSPRQSVNAFVKVQDWAKGFERYIASGDDQIAKDLVEEGHRVYAELCASQSSPHLLHGDLHHYNVLFDSDRGWLAIDPKGVVGEVEYEIGAALRNPYERPELFTQLTTVQNRLRRFASVLNLNFERALGWAFAQAVLSAIWSVEDGYSVGPGTPTLALAEAIRPMLGAQY